MTGPAALPLDVVAAEIVAAGVPVAGALRAELISGGRSNLTFSVTDGRSRWILRRPPAAGLTSTAHDIAREFTVTHALHGSEVPVARPVLLCQDDSVIGAPFMVADWVEGAVVRDLVQLSGRSDGEIHRCVESLVGVLVGLHAIDVAAVGLAGFGRPDGFLSRQLALWRRQWDQVQTQDLRDVERLHERLVEAVPSESATALIHGDYRIDNAILDEADLARVRAIVDWELSTIGDPLTDVALMCIYRDAALNDILGVEAAWTSDRLPSPDDLADAYARTSGRPLRNWPFYLGLAHFKLAVIAEGIAYRARAGASVERNAAGASEAVPRLVQAGLRALR